MPDFLIADDSHDKIDFLKHVLDIAKWEGKVFVAVTTEQAKDCIDATPDIAAAFIDFYIPSEYGPAIIRYLKQKNPAARIALVSSSDSRRNAESAKEAGAEAAVCSSYPQDEVERGLLDLLERWKTSA